ncbi:MAG: protein kinase, partial [Acidobacteriota bacterium]|nr:protein kinase [Acidobacteriota bacterium]
KVLDFGLAKLTEPVAANDMAVSQGATVERAPRTEEGTILGTVAYMSPEQAEGKKVDARSDIFSFGSLLYEMVTGRRAFHAETKVATLSAILHKEPRPVSEIAEGIPRELDRIIAHCLRKDPARRFQHLDDVKTLLEELKDESDSGRLVSQSPPAAAPVRWTRQMALVGGIVAVAAVVAIVIMQRSRPSATPPPIRLTSDSGLTTDPALSPDGKLLAFASDRGGGDSLDIWVKQVGGADALRLTTHAADDYEPDFSPDGQRIAFRSDRDGGGIYLVSTLGADARRIAEAGRRP